MSVPKTHYKSRKQHFASIYLDRCAMTGWFPIARTHIQTRNSTFGHVAAIMAELITLTSLAIFIFEQLTLHCLFPNNQPFSRALSMYVLARFRFHQ